VSLNSDNWVRESLMESRNHHSGEFLSECFLQVHGQLSNNMTKGVSDLGVLVIRVSQERFHQGALEEVTVVDEVSDLRKDMESGVLEPPVSLVCEQVLNENTDRAKDDVLTSRVEDSVDALKGKDNGVIFLLL